MIIEERSVPQIFEIMSALVISSFELTGISLGLFHFVALTEPLVPFMPLKQTHTNN